MSTPPSCHSIPKRSPDINRIIINVGGIRFETYKSTLKNIPDTRLAWLTESTSSNAQSDYQPSTGEYFFDRHSGAFTMILNYYRTGKLHTPMDVCGPMFEEELAFWGIDEKQIEPCCWTAYRTHRDAQATVAELNGKPPDETDEEEEDIAMRFGIEEDAHPDQSCCAKWGPKLWVWMEDPNSGPVAKVFASIAVTVILASIVLLCIETLPEVRCWHPHGVNSTQVCFTHPPKGSIKVGYYMMHSTPHISIVILDFIFTAYFTLELIARLTFCPKKTNFLKVGLNWIDIIALVVTYISYCLRITKTNEIVGVWVQLLIVPRIFRIFKLTRHFSGLKILVHTLKASSKELILLSLIFSIFVVLYGTVVYIFEQFLEVENNDFKNILCGFWWALVTMTTVGYGDFVPRSLPGYFIGVICALSGVLVIALPVPIIVNNFALFYTHAQAQQKMPKRRKRVLVGAAQALKQLDAPPCTDDGHGPQNGKFWDSVTGNMNSQDSSRSVSPDVFENDTTETTECQISVENGTINQSLSDGQVNRQDHDKILTSRPRSNTHTGGSSTTRNLFANRKTSLRPNGQVPNNSATSRRVSDPAATKRRSAIVGPMILEENLESVDECDECACEEYQEVF